MARMPSPFRAIAGGALLALACSDGTDLSPADSSSEPSGSESAAMEPNAENSPAELGVEFSLEGFESQNGASASISIRENAGIWLDVGGGLSGNGFLQMRLIMTDVTSLFGPHRASIELPPDPFAQVEERPGDPGGSVASASLDGQDYYSQAGLAEFEILENGELSGTFEVSLAPLAPLEPGQTADFLEVSDPRPVSGQFSGTWKINCYSRIIAHPTWVPGGAYCRSLEL